MQFLIRFAFLFNMLFTSVVWAAAPATGLVVEGDRVPGIALGDSRADVVAAIGAPDFCQSAETAGDRGSCNFPVEGGGAVSVRYRGVNGGNPANSPNDIVHALRWYEAVSGWQTTAGIDTALAAAEPDQVITAYPDAEVTYNMFGGLYSVVDHAQGFEVIWVPDFYTGQVHVNMAIFAPRTPPPPVSLTTRVTDIEMSSSKRRGKRTVRALVQVRDQDGSSAAGAIVTAAWTNPDGTSATLLDVTSMSGYAYFEVTGAKRGNHGLTIEHVDLEDHDFDTDASVLGASITVR
ncbi:MAG TPA: hypothetical protein VJ984_04375 [Xanthomonadales bacterium]|nr:hypothetical protein [Xanthomonadales bacterium]